MIEGTMPALFTFAFPQLTLPSPWKVLNVCVHKELIYTCSLSAPSDAAETRFRWYSPGRHD